MFLANIGDVMAKAFRYAYGRGCCYLCRRKRIRNYALNKQAVRNVREGRLAQDALHGPSKTGKALEVDALGQHRAGVGAMDEGLFLIEELPEETGDYAVP